jgi:hypothetical protein
MLLACWRDAEGLSDPDSGSRADDATHDELMARVRASDLRFVRGLSRRPFLGRGFAHSGAQTEKSPTDESLWGEETRMP